MSFLDLAGSFLSQGGGDTQSQLLQAALILIQNQPGGLQGLLGRFQERGLGEQAASWVGTGENLPLQPHQVQQALGGEQLEALARQTGLSSEHVGGGLAALLPDLINQLTPDGQVPQEGGLQKSLGLLGNLLG